MNPGERQCRCYTALVLIGAALVLAAVAPDSHQRNDVRSLKELHLKDRPLATHYHRVDPNSFSYRSERSVGPAIPNAEEKQQQATPPAAYSSEAEKKAASAKDVGLSEAPLADAAHSGVKAANESVISTAGSESETERKGRLMEKLKAWYKGKESEKEDPRGIIINSHLSTGHLDPHGHHHHIPVYHQPPFVQPIIIGTGGGSKDEDPVVITKPVTHYITVTQPVAITVTETQKPSHVLTHTTVSTYMTPSHVYIQEPKTLGPVTVTLGSHEANWGWNSYGMGEAGGSIGGDHVVYLVKPGHGSGVSSSSQIVIQEAPSAGSGDKPTTSEVMVIESPGHVLNKGIQTIKDTFSGIYNVGKGIKDKFDSQVSSLFDKDDHEVIVVHKPHTVTVSSSKSTVASSKPYGDPHSDAAVQAPRARLRQGRFRGPRPLPRRQNYDRSETCNLYYNHNNGHCKHARLYTLRLRRRRSRRIQEMKKKMEAKEEEKKKEEEQKESEKKRLKEGKTNKD
ncbi:uncharacterized protein LOC125035782 [Penaeus chinensis]|uniref:uncharacterized protein LOC125035782 n=1 Tax=Penaeus chinensis TaxID=139456 RepID=UPI001FB6F3C0|nr:uncharacterized protein LOC125035782 [Penaeus chinensis]